MIEHDLEHAALNAYFNLMWMNSLILEITVALGMYNSCKNVHTEHLDS